MASEPLHLIQLRLDQSGLLQLGRRLGLPLRDVDEGYLVHCMLGQLFGDHAPRPFTVARHEGRTAVVLAYSGLNGEALSRIAQESAEPEVHGACDWKRLASKPMPTEWPAGRRLGFEVRVCPVVRKSKPTNGEQGGGPEVDAFLDACWAVGKEESIDREVVYRKWLARQVDRLGGAGLSDVRMTRFKRARLIRRRKTPRTSHVLERPDATLEGTLEVTDPEAFQRLVARGVGRHRGFGFGMLLLRQAR